MCHPLGRLSSDSLVGGTAKCRRKEHVLSEETHQPVDLEFSPLGNTGTCVDPNDRTTSLSLSSNFPRLRINPH